MEAHVAGESETGMSIMNPSSVADRNEAKSRQRAMNRATLSSLPRTVPFLQDELLTYLSEIKGRRSDPETKWTELYRLEPTSSRPPSKRSLQKRETEMNKALADGKAVCRNYVQPKLFGCG